jgi:hypothetical protein
MCSYLRGRGVRIPLNFGYLNLNQTTDLVGEGPIRLIDGATNEWLISRDAAPHASLDTRCWFLTRSSELLLLKSQPNSRPCRGGG